MRDTPINVRALNAGIAAQPEAVSADLDVLGGRGPLLDKQKTVKDVSGIT